MVQKSQELRMMSESRGVRPRIWRPAIGLTLVAMAGLAAVCIFARCSGGQSVTPEAIAAARKVWAEAGIRDYDLEWSASGITSAHYYVTVRQREVREVDSIASDGRRIAVPTHEPRYFGVDGLFTTIADELAQLKTDQPFGQPKGTKVVMRFTPDPRLGYPRSYRRDVLGTSQGLAIDVIRLIPKGSSSGSPPTPRS
jgi:Family of unknown function (DUF6174)